MNSKITQTFSKGFTLIELLVTVAIMGILLGLAMPSYLKQTERQHRTEAKIKLLEIQSQLERYYNLHLSYPEGLSELKAYDSNLVDTESKYYQIELDTCDEGFCCELIANHSSGLEKDVLSLRSSGEKNGPW